MVEIKSRAREKATETHLKSTQNQKMRNLSSLSFESKLDRFLCEIEGKAEITTETRLTDDEDFW